MSSFQELSVWQHRHDLSLMIYKMRSSFPKEELFGLRFDALPFLLVLILQKAMDATAIQK